jgi:hypothetical protein
MRVRLGRLVYTSAVWTLATALPSSGQTIGVDYAKLSAQQQALFQSFSGCSSSACPGEWQKLNSTEQLEFAGGTQALQIVQLQPTSLNGLDAVESVLHIHGSEPSQPSEKQFNVETNWKSGAPNQFEDAPGWSPHIAVFHPGQYGYQENREGNPFLGLVVLFDKHPDVQSGQLHIDFRSWFAHFCSDNGNIAANYKKYAQWYGPLQGYSPVFQFIFPDLARDEMSRNVPKSSVSRANMGVCSTDIDEAVLKFLTTWYVDRNAYSLLDFVAQDNVYNVANLENLGVKSPTALWIRLFSDAFEPSSTHISKLEGALQYHAPIFRNPAIKLRYVNPAVVASDTATYAIIAPDSLPSGTLFPRSDATKSQRAEWDSQAGFLDHLHEAYQAKLHVVVYATIAPGLVHETAVQYWIKEGACWRISAFQGTDW